MVVGCEECDIGPNFDPTRESVIHIECGLLC